MNYYILKASGDSMEDAGIRDGDLVVIRKDCEAAEGDIIAALTGENESTLKVYAGVDRETGEAVLRYRNEARYPGKEIRVKELICQGVAKHVIRALLGSDLEASRVRLRCKCGKVVKIRTQNGIVVIAAQVRQQMAEAVPAGTFPAGR